MPGDTLYDKLWAIHTVRNKKDGTSLLYIDRQLIHEVTSPQAFEGLRLAGRNPWRTTANVAVPDHNIPTQNRDKGITDPISKLQVDTLDKNCDSWHILGMERMKIGLIEKAKRNNDYRLLLKTTIHS